MEPKDPFSILPAEHFSDFNVMGPTATPPRTINPGMPGAEIYNEASAQGYRYPEDILATAIHESNMDAQAILPGETKGNDVMGAFQIKRSIADKKGIDPLNIRDATDYVLQKRRASGLRGSAQYLQHQQGEGGSSRLKRWAMGEGKPWNSTPEGSEAIKNMAYQARLMRDIVDTPQKSDRYPYDAPGARRSVRLKEMLANGEITQKDLAGKFLDAMGAEYGKSESRASSLIGKAGGDPGETRNPQSIYQSTTRTGARAPQEEDQPGASFSDELADAAMVYEPAIKAALSDYARIAGMNTRREADEALAMTQSQPSEYGK